MNALNIIETLNPLTHLVPALSQKKTRKNGKRTSVRRITGFPYADAHTLDDIGLNMHKVSFRVARRVGFE
ncbi:MAG: hypothetical protein AAF420_13470 [Pseudomonadota bacterium]